MGVLIKNGRVVDPANGIDKVQNLYIESGKIAALGEAPAGFSADLQIDAGDQIVCPGIVDLCVRLREPGFEHKGNIDSESAAAARAGITTVCCPPDTNPIIDTPAVVEHIQERIHEVGKTKVALLGALTQQLDGKQLSEMYALKQAGCVGVTNVTRAVRSAVMRRAMEYAASHDLTVFINPQDHALSAKGCAHEGKVSVRLGLPGIPETAETVAVARELQLITLTGVRAHFSHLSSARAVQMVARAQFEGLPVSVDVTTHHLFLTEMDIGYFNSNCHVQPPLRTQRDLQALRAGLQRGTVAAICSDHQPHDVDAKLAPFPSTEPGISAMETLLPLTLRLVEDELLSLPQAIDKITRQPAQILGIDRGTLSVGSDADICIFDPTLYWEVNDGTIISFGKNTPFKGWEMKGKVTYTLLNGNVVYPVG
jgi:dihydroorotase